MEYLIWAYEAMREQRGATYSIDNDQRSFATIWRDVAHAFQSWPDQVVPLVDTGNWNVNPPRRPKAYLSVHITDKGE